MNAMILSTGPPTGFAATRATAMRTRPVRFSLLALLTALLILLPACGARTDPNEIAAAEALDAVKAQDQDPVVTATDLRDKVDACVRIYKAYPNTQAARDALPYAEHMFLEEIGDVSDDRVYQDVLSTLQFYTPGDAGTLADMVAFRKVMPATYDSSATRGAGLKLCTTIALDQARQIADLGAKAVSAAKALASGERITSALTLGSGPDYKVEAKVVAFERGLVKRLDGSKRLDLAYRSIQQALRYAIAYEAAGGHSNFDTDSNTWTTLYTPTEVAAMRSSGEELQRRARRIRQLIRSSPPHR